MATIETPVLIVGAGPVGLALAADLGSRGVPCLVVEQGDGVPEHPRASAINARSMEFMRRWGIADKVREVGTPPDFPAHRALLHDAHRVSRSRASSGRTTAAAARRRGQPRAAAALQPALARPGAARACARASPASTSAYRARFESLREDGDRVIATVHDLARDQRIEIAARLSSSIAAAGTRRSAAQLGIGMSGSSYLGYFISIFVRAPELWTHHTMGKAALMQLSSTPNGLWRNLVNLDGRELYRFGISGKAFYDAPDKVDAEQHVPRGRRQGRAARDPFGAFAGPRATWWPTVTRPGASSSPATPRISTIRPPGSGSTPASATRSISAGSSRPCITAGAALRLLDSYEIERRPVGIRNVGHADESHAGDRERAPGPGDRRRYAGRRARPPARWATPSSRARPEGDHRRARARLSLRPLARSSWPDGTPAPEDTITDYHPTARPGSRAPHALHRARAARPSTCSAAALC